MTLVGCFVTPHPPIIVPEVGGAQVREAQSTFEAMREAYCRVFTRCGLPYRIVEASAGSMGGTGTLEFMAPAEHGEDTILLCDGCGYAANAEMAQRRAPAEAPFKPGSLNQSPG